MRAVKGGMGPKTAGNYSASLKAQDEGGKEGLHPGAVDEMTVSSTGICVVGTRNFFAINGEVITPSL